MRDRIKISSLFVDLVFPVYLVLNLFTMTTFCYVPQDGPTPTFAIVVKLLRYMIYVISLGKFVVANYKRKEFRLAIFVLGIFAISLIFNHDTEYFCYILVFLALLDAPREKIISKHFWVTLVFMSVLIIGSQIGVIEDIVTSDIRLRHFLGFNWVTYPSVLLLFLVLDWAYLKKGRIKVYQAVLFSLAGYWLYVMTNSRFAFACMFVSVWFFVFTNTYKAISERKKRKYYILCSVPIICLIVSFVIAKVFNSAINIMNVVNTLLSQRLRLMHEAIQIYPIKIIGGQVIEWQGFNKDNTSFIGYNYVDNSYIQLLLQYGMLLLLVVIIFYTIGIYRGVKENKRYLSWILAIICLYCILDPFLIRFTFNPFVWLGAEIVKPKVKATNNMMMYRRLEIGKARRLR